MTCCAVWGFGLHSQDGESARSLQNILLLKCPIPVQRWLNFIQSFQVSFDPGGALVFGKSVNWSGLEITFQLLLQTPRRMKLES